MFLSGTDQYFVQSVSFLNYFTISKEMFPWQLKVFMICFTSIHSLILNVYSAFIRSISNVNNTCFSIEYEHAFNYLWLFLLTLYSIDILWKTVTYKNVIVVTFANSLDLDQTTSNSASDQAPSFLTLRLNYTKYS